MKVKASDLKIGDKIKFADMVLSIYAIECVGDDMIGFMAEWHDNEPIRTPDCDYYHANSFSANRIVSRDAEVEVVEEHSGTKWQHDVCNCERCTLLRLRTRTRTKGLT